MSDSSIHELFRNPFRLAFPQWHLQTSLFRKAPYFYFLEKGISRSYCVIDGIASYLGISQVTLWQLRKNTSDSII